MVETSWNGFHCRVAVVAAVVAGGRIASIVPVELPGSCFLAFAAVATGVVAFVAAADSSFEAVVDSSFEAAVHIPYCYSYCYSSSSEDFAYSYSFRPGSAFPPSWVVAYSCRPLVQAWASSHPAAVVVDNSLVA